MRDDTETAEALAQKIRHHIIISSGKSCPEASDHEFYRAFCSVLREEIGIQWSATIQSIETARTRIAYFLSMEYLPGRYTNNNLANLNAQGLLQRVVQLMGRNFREILECEPDPGLGNGGLGRLASCFLDSLATLQYPARAYGLRYQYGVFEQEIWAGQQIERPDCWLLEENAWEQRRDQHACTVKFRGRTVPATNKHGEEVHLIEETEEVRALPYDTPIIGYSSNSNYSVLTLRLWSTKESPRNFHLQRFNAGLLEQAAENTSLTDVLYPNENTELGKRVRLKQEFLLVAASLHDILRRHLRIYGDLTDFADKTRIQINDTHPALVVAELMRTLTKNYDCTWNNAWEICQQVCSYTNHTILREALEEWNEKKFQELIPRQYAIVQRLNLDFCNLVRRRFPGDEEKVRRMSILENGHVRMAHLAIVGSHKINGVAELHGEILKHQVFRDFHDLWPDKFLSITNGVTQRRWLLNANPRLAALITQRIGPRWTTDFSAIAALAAYATDPEVQQEFLAIKQENKRDLLHFLRTETFLRDQNGKPIVSPSLAPPTALLSVQAKRIHEYKRQLLNALHILHLYRQLKDNPNASPLPRLFLFAGKAAAGYEKAKQILQLLNALSRTLAKDPIAQGRLAVVFVENYGVSKAEQIIPAADLSEQLSLAGWEASGTGNMKLAMNGALTIGTHDGANIEMHRAVTDSWWPFAFGATAEQNRQPYKAWDVYVGNPHVRRAVDSLIDATLDQTPADTAAFKALHRSLTEGDDHTPADRFRVLQDFASYCAAQKKAEALFQQPQLWAATALHNIAAMGPFSTDASIRRYAQEVWGITPCPPRPDIADAVRKEYAEHDRCNIGPGK